MSTYKYEVKNNEVLSNKNYWFANVKDLVNADQVEFDIEKMNVNENGDDGELAYLHYPNIPAGYPSIRLETEDINSFSLTPHKNTGMIFPLTFKSINPAGYQIVIPAFQYTTDSAVHIDRVEFDIKNSNGQSVLKNGKTIITVDNKSFKRFYDKDNEIFYIVRGNFNQHNFEWESDFQNSYSGSSICNFTIGPSDLNQWFTFTATYYNSEFSQTENHTIKYYPLGTYELKFNQYLMDVLGEFLELYAQPHEVDGYNTGFVSQKLDNTSESEYIDYETLNGVQFQFNKVASHGTEDDICGRFDSDLNLNNIGLTNYEYLYRTLKMRSDQINIKLFNNSVDPILSFYTPFLCSDNNSNNQENYIQNNPPVVTKLPKISLICNISNDLPISLPVTVDTGFWYESNNRQHWKVTFTLSNSQEVSFSINQEKLDVVMESNSPIFSIGISDASISIQNTISMKDFLNITIPDREGSHNSIITQDNPNSGEVFNFFLKVRNKSDYALVTQLDFVGRDYSKTELFTPYGYDGVADKFTPCNLLIENNLLAGLVYNKTSVKSDFKYSLEECHFYPKYFNPTYTQDLYLQLQPGSYFLNCNFYNKYRLDFILEDSVTGAQCTVTSECLDTNHWKKRDTQGVVIYAPNYFIIRSIKGYAIDQNGNYVVDFPEFTSCGLYKINEYLDSEPSKRFVQWKNQQNKLSWDINKDFKYVTTNLIIGLAENVISCLDKVYCYYNDGAEGYQTIFSFLDVKYLGTGLDPNSGYKSAFIDLPDGQNISVKFRQLIE